jgi:hypothetical protein
MKRISELALDFTDSLKFSDTERVTVHGRMMISASQAVAIGFMEGANTVIEEIKRWSDGAKFKIYTNPGCIDQMGWMVLHDYLVSKLDEMKGEE